MSPKETLNDKQILRSRMRGLASQHLERDASSHCQTILGSIEWQNATTILIYDPLPSEPDLLPLITESNNRRILFPRIEGDDLRLYLYRERLSWINSPLGFREPDPSNWEAVYPHEVDLALLPGLAFDSAGARLGRGAGFYDRLLGRPDFRAVKFGVCWPWQLVDSVPRETHDQIMDRVISGRFGDSLNP